MVLSVSSFSLSLFLSTRSFRAFTDYKRWHNSLSHVALNESQPDPTEKREREKYDSLIIRPLMPCVCLLSIKIIKSSFFLFFFPFSLTTPVDLYTRDSSSSSCSLLLGQDVFLLPQRVLGARSAVNQTFLFFRVQSTERDGNM